VGAVPPDETGVTVAETASVLPGWGVVVPRVTATVGGVTTVRVTWGEVDAA
jgi:hypothetical protein